MTDQSETAGSGAAREARAGALPRQHTPAGHDQAAGSSMEVLFIVYIIIVD